MEETAEGTGGVVEVMRGSRTEGSGGGFEHAEEPFSEYPERALKMWDGGVWACG